MNSFLSVNQRYFIPQYTNVVLVFYLTGRSSAASTMLLLWAISAEMYPTNLRGQACGFFFTVANSVALLAPFVAPLAHYWKPLPMLLFSVPCFVISGLTRYLPETKSVQLPQTMKDTDDGIDT